MEAGGGEGGRGGEWKGIFEPEAPGAQQEQSWGQNMLWGGLREGAWRGGTFSGHQSGLVPFSCWGPREKP